MDSPGICAYFGCHGNRLENTKAQARRDGGRHPPMTPDVYSAVGIAAIVAAVGIVGLRVIRDEASLRKKRAIAAKF